MPFISLKFVSSIYCYLSSALVSFFYGDNNTHENKLDRERIQQRWLKICCQRFCNCYCRRNNCSSRGSSFPSSSVRLNFLSCIMLKFVYIVDLLVRISFMNFFSLPAFYTDNFCCIRFLSPGRYAIAKGRSYSYILQVAISLGQLYGTAVYFITSLLEGDNFATNEFYYYAYYVLANSFWILVPSLIVIRCWKKICAAIQVQGQKKSKTR